MGPPTRLRTFVKGSEVISGQLGEPHEKTLPVAPSTLVSLPNEILQSEIAIDSRCHVSLLRREINWICARSILVRWCAVWKERAKTCGDRPGKNPGSVVKKWNQGKNMWEFPVDGLPLPLLCSTNLKVASRNFTCVSLLFPGHRRELTFGWCTLWRNTTTALSRHTLPTTCAHQLLPSCFMLKRREGVGLK